MLQMLNVINVVSKVVLGGENIGFSLKADGLIVSGTYDVATSNMVYNPKNSDIRVGDIIYEIEDRKIESINDVNNLLEDIDEEEVEIKIRRNKNNLVRRLRLVTKDGRKRTGLYVKERLLGIGTVSYYDPVSKTYGALGHPVKESGGEIFDISSGEIYESSVTSIKPSSSKSVGEKVATLDQNSIIGDVKANMEYGIVGSYTKLPEDAIYLDVAKINEVEKGPAKLYTVIDKSYKEAFDIEIIETKKQTIVDTKGLTFVVKDERLINKTGGIVAGMSGSPIVQKGKIVGAVTHVIVNEPLKGYGIYLDSMMKGLNSWNQ